MSTSNPGKAGPRTSTRWCRNLALVTVGLLGAATLAACGGSALSPLTVQEANSSISGAGAGGATSSTGGAGAGGATSSTGGGSTSPGGSGQLATSQQQSSTSSDAGTSTGAVGPATIDDASGSSGGGQSTGAGHVAGIKAGSCAGFKNGPGITSSTITIGNAADVSGPVPGLFTAAQQATKAYVAYFNATNPQGICGRKLALDTYDTRTDAGANQVAYTAMCNTDFASIGSMSAFDSGAGPTAAHCGLPSLNAAAVTGAFNACATCFGVDATGDGEFSNEAYDFWIRNEKAATQKAAFLYINAGAAAENAKTQIAVGRKRGINWVYTSPIDVADFNYGPYVQQMKSKGVQMVQFLGAWQMEVRFLQALQQANYEPKVRMFDPSAYETGFLAAGSAVEGAYMYLINTPLDEHQPELDLYKRWLGQVAPGATPTFFGTFAWSAAKLFVEQALKLGGRLDRASLVQSIKGVNDWTGGGMHGPMAIGSKHPASCVRYLVVKNDKWVPYKSTKYVCGGYSKA